MKTSLILLFLFSQSLWAELPSNITINADGFYSPIKAADFEATSTYDSLISHYSGSDLGDDVLARYSYIDSMPDSPGGRQDSGYFPPSYKVNRIIGRESMAISFDLFEDIKKHRRDYGRTTDEIYTRPVHMDKVLFRPPPYGSYQNLKDLMNEKFSGNN